MNEKIRAVLSPLLVGAGQRCDECESLLGDFRVIRQRLFGRVQGL